MEFLIYQSNHFVLYSITKILVSNNQSDICIKTTNCTQNTISSFFSRYIKKFITL